MKKVAEIMDELGFRPDASDSVKKAFIKNLIKEAHTSEYKRAALKRDNKEPAVDRDKKADQYIQISLFDQKISS